MANTILLFLLLFLSFCGTIKLIETCTLRQLFLAVTGHLATTKSRHQSSCHQEVDSPPTNSKTSGEEVKIPNLR